MQLLHDRGPDAAVNVSILTRPEDRVQRHLPVPGCRVLSDVSILTRPEDRVQLERAEILAQAQAWFQSSPGPKTGCNLLGGTVFGSFDLLVSILTRPEDRVQQAEFDEQQAATLNVSILTRPEDRVQRVGFVQLGGDGMEVSILTRPEDRVQPPQHDQVRDDQSVSILTRPEDRVQLRYTFTGRKIHVRFQSSPGPKTGCNGG